MAVQMEIERREKPINTKKTYPFSGLLKCAKCGKSYRRKVTATGPVWICATYNTRGKKHCPSKQIPESTLEAVVYSLTDDVKSIEKIIVDDDNALHFHFVDGLVVTRTWADRSRAESWTEEMRAEMAERKRRRYA